MTYDIIALTMLTVVVSLFAVMVSIAERDWRRAWVSGWLTLSSGWLALGEWLRIFQFDPNWVLVEPWRPRVARLGVFCALLALVWWPWRAKRRRTDAPPPVFKEK